MQCVPQRCEAQGVAVGGERCPSGCEPGVEVGDLYVYGFFEVGCGEFFSHDVEVLPEAYGVPCVWVSDEILYVVSSGVVSECGGCEGGDSGCEPETWWLRCGGCSWVVDPGVSGGGFSV